jgi:hypothetical protein
MPTPHHLLWLLEEDNPSVRYFTVTDILDRPATTREAGAARQAIMTTGPVPMILAKQRPEGCWGEPEDFYVNGKYKNTAWTLILLAELGANGRDERVRRACEFILQWSQDPKSGGFAYRGSAQGGQPGAIIPCLTGNMVWSLIRLGRLNDARIKQAIRWITTYQRFDDGDTTPPQGWPYMNDRCWGRHTCHMGVLASLKALAEIPERKRTGPVRATIAAGAEHLLRHRIFKRSHNPDQVARADWLKLCFPVLWRFDVLEALEILTRLGYHDDRMQDAIDLVLSKRNVQGVAASSLWRNEDRFMHRYQVRLDREGCSPRGRPSKWITLRALRVLNRWQGRDGNRPSVRIGRPKTEGAQP